MKRLVGVVHLLPLPGGPTRSPGLAAVLERARADARALADGGADGVIVENFGDAPFTRDAVEPYTVAAMTLAAAAVHDAAPGLALGINVLRNDAAAALGIAAAVGASFIRVNVHIGAMVTDQGVIQGEARRTLLDRRRLDADPIRVAADVRVKHAAPLGDWPLDVAARDTFHRGHAEVLIVSGTGTGAATNPSDVAVVKAAVPSAELWLGSGLTPDNADQYSAADGAVVGTWLHADADLRRPLDPRRVAAMRAAWR